MGRRTWLKLDFYLLQALCTVPTLLTVVDAAITLHLVEHRHRIGEAHVVVATLQAFATCQNARSMTNVRARTMRGGRGSHLGWCKGHVAT